MVGVVVGSLVLLGAPARGHRLDEYLQATTIEVGRARVGVEMRMTPGVGVFREVLAAIDADGDGVVSEADQKAYVKRVINDVSVKVDGRVVALKVVSAAFPTLEEMWGGTGEIVLKMEGEVREGAGDRVLEWEDRHLAGVSVYLVNCLVPVEAGVRVVGQGRNEGQSVDRVEYRVGEKGR